MVSGYHCIETAGLPPYYIVFIGTIFQYVVTVFLAKRSHHKEDDSGPDGTQMADLPQQQRNAVSQKKRFVYAARSFLAWAFLAMYIAQWVLDIIHMADKMADVDGFFQGYQCYVLLLTNSANFKTGITTILLWQLITHSLRQLNAYGDPMEQFMKETGMTGVKKTYFYLVQLMTLLTGLPFAITHFFVGCIMFVYVWGIASLGVTFVFYIFRSCIWWDRTSGLSPRNIASGAIITALCTVGAIGVINTMAHFYDSPNYFDAFVDAWTERNTDDYKDHLEDNADDVFSLFWIIL